jgi:hypothetical protein
LTIFQQIITGSHRLTGGLRGGIGRCITWNVRLCRLRLRTLRGIRTSSSTLSIKISTSGQKSLIKASSNIGTP